MNWSEVLYDCLTLEVLIQQGSAYWTTKMDDTGAVISELPYWERTWVTGTTR